MDDTFLSGELFRCELGSPAREWVHFRLEDDVGALVEQAAVGEDVAEALLVSNARPRANRMAGGLCVVLRGVNLSAGAEPEDMVSVRLWLDDDRVVSVSPRRVFAVEDVHDEIEAGEGPSSSGQLLAAVAARLAARMAPTLDDLDDTVDDLEGRVLDEATEAELGAELAHARRVIAKLRRHIAPQRDALTRLCRETLDPLDADDRLAVREVAERTIRYVEDLEALRDRAAVVFDQLDHAQNAVINRNMYVMSLAAAIFLPLSFVTGLLGINVGGIPGVEHPAAFWIVTIGLLVLGGAVVFALRRWRMF